MQNPHTLVPVGMMGVQTNAMNLQGDLQQIYHGELWMKALVCWMLLSIALLAYASEELLWTPVNIPGLKVAEGGTLNLGLWFYGGFGWLNTGWQLWITHDAGRSWTLSLTAPEHRLFYDSDFINASEGWAVAGIGPSFLFHTQDGGKTWQPVEFKLTQTSDKPLLPGNLLLVRIYFKDSQHGLGTFVIDSFPQWGGSIVARTEDGGQQWREIARNSSFPQLFGFGDQVWIDRNYSPDFGETFQRISKPREYFDIFLVSPSYGWGLNDTLLENQKQRWEVVVTFDGGFTWSDPIFSRITGSNGSGIPDLCLMSEEIGGFLWYPSREEGAPLLYLTPNGGLSWFSYPVPFERGQGVILRFPYRMSCNRERKEVWLFPSPSSEDRTLFYASIETITAVHPSNKLFSTWAAMKKIRKEF